MFPSDTSLDSNIRKLLASCHKETQTGRPSLQDSSTSTLSENDDTYDRGSLKIYEFSELIQDPSHPSDITIIKDIYAEETHDHNSPHGSMSDDAIANRYTYCREVIKPYLKDYPKDCPVSDEELIRNALDAAHEDFPDYEPCFEGYDGNQSNILDKKDTVVNILGIKDKEDWRSDSKIQSGSSSINSFPKDTRKIQSSKSKASVCSKKDTTNKSQKTKIDSSSKISNMDQDKICPPAVPKQRDHRCPKKGKCPPSLEPCPGNEDDPPPGPPKLCENKLPESGSTCRSRLSVEACRDKPAPNKEKGCEQQHSNTTLSQPQEEKKKTMMEAHSETIATIKTAVEDFFGKVYKTTKDAVTELRTESARHLGRITAKKSGGSTTDLIPQRIHENKSSETITSFSYFRSTENPDIKSQGTEHDDDNDHLSRAGQAIGKIFAKVDSTISMLSDQVNIEKVSSLLKFESKEQSSPYDSMPQTEDEPTSNSTSLPGSVFTAIRTKIASMFSEGDETKKSSSSNSSSSCNENVSLKPSKKRF